MTMQTLFQNVKDAVNASKVKVAAATVLAVGVIGNAHAQVTGSEAAFDSIQTEFSSLIGFAWPIIGTITASFVGVRVFKRLANRI